MLLGAQAAIDDPVRRTALLVPTTTCILDCKAYRAAMVVSSETARTGHVSPVSALGSLKEGGRPALLLVHSDQLVMPAVANILVRLGGFEAFISSLEFILCSKHGYRLGAWTRERVRYLAPGSSIDEVSRLVVRHLQDCASLGERWLSASIQGQRTYASRQAHRERMVRFVQSSIACAFHDSPHDARLGELLRSTRQAQLLAGAGTAR